MMKLIDIVREAIRSLVGVAARWLNKVSRGRISPDQVTIVGMLAHIPIAFLIATGNHNVLAALLLVFFGLFDTLDGQLAKVQKRESARGMLLDSATDRVKEVFLYIGIAYALIAAGAGTFVAALVVAALGFSMFTSYLNAMGDAIMARHKAGSHSSNKAFRGGWLPFEIRMTVLILGLLTGQLLAAVSVIALLAGYTALQRMVRVSKALSGV